jgi:hypothetical protein
MKEILLKPSLKLFSFLLIFVFLTSSFEPINIYESLINSVSSKIVPPSYRYFYLLDTGYAINFTPLIDSLMLNYVSKIDSEFKDVQATDFEYSDSAIIWSELHIVGARYISRDSAMANCGLSRQIGFINKKNYKVIGDSLNKSKQYYQIFIPIKEPKRKNKRNRLLHLYGDSLELTIPKEINYYFHFSKPLFTKSKKYAIVEIGNQYSSSIYLLKQQSVQWVEISKLFTID